MAAAPPPELDAEQEVDFGRYWRVIASRWWLVVGGLVVGLIIGYLVALGTNLALLDAGTIYAFTLAAQLLVLLAAALAGTLPLLPLRIARYYVLMTASIAAGFWDRIRHGTPGAWEKAEGTR